MDKKRNKIQKDNRIFLLKGIIKNTELSDEALAVYVAIRYLLTKDKVCFFSDYILYRILFGYGCHNPKDKALLNLRKGMYDLFNTYQFGNECIGKNTYMLDEQDKEEWMIDTVNTPIYDDDFFFTINWQHINKIFSVPGKIDKFKLFRLYLVMASTINVNTQIGFTGRDKFVEWTGLSSATITKYQKLLVNIKVLHIVENGAIKNKRTGEFINMSNTYSFYENAKYCDELAKERRDDIKKDRAYFKMLFDNMNDEEYEDTDLSEMVTADDTLVRTNVRNVLIKNGYFGEEDVEFEAEPDFDW